MRLMTCHSLRRGWSVCRRRREAEQASLKESRRWWIRGCLTRACSSSPVSLCRRLLLSAIACEKEMKRGGRPSAKAISACWEERQGPRGKRLRRAPSKWEKKAQRRAVERQQGPRSGFVGRQQVEESGGVQRGRKQQAGAPERASSGGTSGEEKRRVLLPMKAASRSAARMRRPRAPAPPPRPPSLLSPTSPRRSAPPSPCLHPPPATELSAPLIASARRLAFFVKP